MSFDDTLRDRGTLQGWLDNPSAGGTVRMLSFEDFFSQFRVPVYLIPSAPVPQLSLPDKPSASFIEWGGPATTFNFETTGAE